MQNKMERDNRLDVVRGAALLIICTDHIRGSWLAAWTPKNFGFSDMAEVFVFLSGYVCGLAYGRRMAVEGFSQSMVRVGKRCAQLILAMMAVPILLTLLVSQNPSDLPLSGWIGSVSGITNADTFTVSREHELVLGCCSGAAGTLSLYVTFLLALPVMLMAQRYHRQAVFAISLCIYLVAQLVSTRDDGSSNALTGYFDPLAWQLLFFGGTALAFARQRPRTRLVASPVARIIAFIFLDVSAVIAVYRPYALAGWSAKDHLGPMRVLHFLCLLVVVAPVIEKFSVRWAGAFLMPVAACGRNSLATFSMSWIIAAISTLVLRERGQDYRWQLAVNIAAWAGCILTACGCDMLKRAWRQNINREAKTTQEAITDLSSSPENEAPLALRPRSNKAFSFHMGLIADQSKTAHPFPGS
jgi:hypothetical protein